MISLFGRKQRTLSKKRHKSRRKTHYTILIKIKNKDRRKIQEVKDFSERVKVE